MKRIGLLGGSFNPAHAAHRRISLFALDTLGLDEVWWLVSPGNPLKARATDMASMPARLASAQRMARHAPIVPTAIETLLGTRYTVDTLRAIVRRYPNDRFVWIMGTDNLAQFDRWRDWREIAKTLPIAVVARPGYGGDARSGVAMGWLRRFGRPASGAKRWTRWSLPALVQLHTFPDPTSATARRAADPDWHRQINPRTLRDRVTHRAVSPEVHCPLPPPPPAR